MSPVLFVTELELSTELLPPPNNELIPDVILDNKPVFLFFSTVVYEITFPSSSTCGITSVFLDVFAAIVFVASFVCNPSTSVVSSIR